MAITSITVDSSNIVSGANLLSIHNPVTFIVNANYSGDTPDELNCEIREIDDTVLETYRCIPYRDITLNQRQFIFKSSKAIKALMDDFDDFSQLNDTLEYVEGLTRNLKLRFVSPASSLIYTEIILDFCHAARQYSESVNLIELYNNSADTYYSPSNKPCYVYFYNNDASNSVSITPPVITPYVLFASNPLYFGYVENGSDLELSVQIDGFNIDGDVVLNATTDFQFSLTSGSGFTSSLTIPFSGATFTDTIYIKFSPTSVIFYDTQIVPVINGIIRDTRLRLIASSKQTSLIITDLGITEWVCPVGITNVKVECYGGGGAGMRAINPILAEGGGAGAQYSMSDLTVIPGRIYNISVGSGGELYIDGDDSYFEDSVTITKLTLAKGGESAKFGVAGIGSATGGIGDIVYSGGSGSVGAASYGGGGGGSAGPSGAGGNASGPTGGIDGGGYAGAGGTGGSSGVIPLNGFNYGGGGGGEYYNGWPVNGGGLGSQGIVILTYANYS